MLSKDLKFNNKSKPTSLVLPLRQLYYITNCVTLLVYQKIYCQHTIGASYYCSVHLYFNGPQKVPIWYPMTVFVLFKTLIHPISPPSLPMASSSEKSGELRVVSGKLWVVSSVLFESVREAKCRPIRMAFRPLWWRSIIFIHTLSCLWMYMIPFVV